MNESWLDEIRWTSDGLVPVIAQQHSTGKVLMFAWMNCSAGLCCLLVQVTKKIVEKRRGIRTSTKSSRNIFRLR